ncbi:hypothetical protein F5Y13DRAFT_204818 [Hypoxylon sp. FL1857]|nr:hypothetical protein F5Y13DRAFT_204818 [Hypoxylon sp. FL1857]
MFGNSETEFTPWDDVKFLLNYWEQRKADFYLGLNLYEPYRVDAERAAQSDQPKNLDDIPGELVNYIRNSKRMVSPRIKVRAPDSFTSTDYSRIYERVIYAGQALRPYFGYFRIMIVAREGAKSLCIGARYPLLSTDESGCGPYVHWRWGDWEHLDRFRADPLAALRNQSRDGLPHQDGPGLDWGRPVGQPLPENDSRSQEIAALADEIMRSCRLAESEPLDNSK